MGSQCSLVFFSVNVSLRSVIFAMAIPTNLGENASENSMHLHC